MSANEQTNSRRQFSTIFYLNTESPAVPEAHQCYSLLQLLLGAQVVGVAALLLAAVDGTGVQTGVTPETRASLSHHQIHNTTPRPDKLNESFKAIIISMWSYLRQIIFSQLYFWASCLREGSMMPPLRRSTRWRVDSEE